MRFITGQLASAILAYAGRNSCNCRTVKSCAFSCASAIFRARLGICAYRSIAHLAHRLIGIRAFAFARLTGKAITANRKALARLGCTAIIRMRLRVNAVAVAVYQRTTVFTASTCIAFLVIVTFEFFAAATAVVLVRIGINATTIAEDLAVFADDFAFAVRANFTILGFAGFVIIARRAASLCAV